MDNSMGNRVTVKWFDGTAWNDDGNANFSLGGVYDPALAVDRWDGVYAAYRDQSAGCAVCVMKLDVGPTHLGINAEKQEVKHETSIVAMPNPSVGIFELKINEVSNENAKVIITNILGQKIKEFEVKTNAIYMLNIDVPGLYLINATTTHGSACTKLLVQ